MKKLSVKGNKGKNKRSYVQIMDILLTQLEENLPAKVVASRYDVTLQTVYKWKKIYAKHLENYKKLKEEAKIKNADKENKDLQEEKIHNAACGKRLKFLRTSLNLSQDRIAEILGITVAIYMRMEKGYTVLNSYIITKLYKFLGINPVYLITGEGDSFLIKDPDLFKKINTEQKKYSNRNNTKENEEDLF
ncbi:helix-turn-helix domain-containing protein [Campylobacter jejuni]|nr:helix-turn-helix domain-containing protein [Campylobacter jejuni]EAK0717854.1 helix-turn-helix domain-containing protein [Campylobacter jejuni]EKJ0570577.1 helix-turn-helix domain-containing protein [Campylobacter jejuni]